MSSGKTLCPLPFRHLFINNRGYVQPCCLAYPQYQPSSNEFQRQDVNAVGVAAAIQSERLSRIREKVSESQWPDECGTCKRTENEGNISRRIEELNTSASDDGREVRILSMDLRLGNVCNLACRMCSPFSSAALLPEWKKSPYLLMKNSVNIYDSESWVNWSENEKIWRELAELSGDVRHVNFAGGEPFLNQQHVLFLRQLIAQGRASQIRLSYNTNLSIIPDYLNEMLNHFKSVHLIISVDAVGKLNEYIRHPMKWDKFEQNIEVLTDLNRSYSEKLIVSFNVTVQMYNIFDLDSVLEKLISYRTRGLKSMIHANCLFNPDYFDCVNLPQKLKQSAIAKLNDAVSLIPQADRTQDVAHFVQTVVRHLSGSAQAGKLVEFYEITEFYDRSRNQNFHELVSELRLNP